MATTYLSYTQGTPTNNLKWTWSSWIKRGAVNSSAVEYLFTTYVDASNYFNLRFNDTDFLDIYNYSSGGAAGRMITNRKFRDSGAWYHIVFVYDSANVTADNRMRLYVNGVEETSFVSADTSNPSSSQACIMNANTRVAEIGRRSDASTNFTGLMAHTHFADGQAYAPTVFGETDATSGIWIPISSPSVTYGDNGFFLKYASGALGTDSSGEGNTMTVSGTMTATKDNAVNNFCTLNPLDNYWQESTFSNGNNTIVTATNGHPYNTSTMGMQSGKWYFESKVVSTVGSSMDLVGITDHVMISNTDELSQDNYSYAYVGDGNVRSNGTSVDSGTTYTTGDIISVAVDLTNSKLYFAKNGTWINSGDPTSGATGTGATSIQAVASTTGAYQFAVGDWSGAAAGTYSTNFGNGYFGTTAISSGNADDAGYGDFEYDVPAGYYTLCTNNLGDQS